MRIFQNFEVEKKLSRSSVEFFRLSVKSYPNERNSDHHVILFVKYLSNQQNQTQTTNIDGSIYWLEGGGVLWCSEIFFPENLAIPHYTFFAVSRSGWSWKAFGTIN